jgi:hypothetical protein
MTQRGSPQTVAGIAHEIMYIDQRIGMGRWRIASGTPCDGAASVPYVELPDWSRINDINELIYSPAITKCPKIELRKPQLASRHQRARVRTYRLTHLGVRFARGITSQDDSMLPCGHRGIRNPRGVDGVTCQHDGCEAVFSRETVKTDGGGDR